MNVLYNMSWILRSMAFHYPLSLFDAALFPHRVCFLWSGDRDAGAQKLHYGVFSVN